MDKYFASDYAEARGKFLTAAEAADVQASSGQGEP